MSTVPLFLSVYTGPNRYQRPTYFYCKAGLLFSRVLKVGRDITITDTLVLEPESLTRVDCAVAVDTACRISKSNSLLWTMRDASIQNHNNDVNVSAITSITYLVLNYLFPVFTTEHYLEHPDHS